MRLDSCLPIFCLRINRDSYASGSLLPRLNHFDAFFVYAVFKVRRSSYAAFAACPRQEFLSGSSFMKFCPSGRTTVFLTSQLRCSIRKTCSGGHLLSRTVSSAVPSAVRVLTVVFGMGTGVTPGRIAARFFQPLIAEQ